MYQLESEVDDELNGAPPWVYRSEGERVSRTGRAPDSPIETVLLGEPATTCEAY